MLGETQGVLQVGQGKKKDPGNKILAGLWMFVRCTVPSVLQGPPGPREHHEGGTARAQRWKD